MDLFYRKKKRLPAKINSTDSLLDFTKSFYFFNKAANGL